MNYLFLALATFLLSGQSVLAKKYNISNSGKKAAGPFYYLAFLTVCFLFYAIYTVLDFSFDRAVLPYSAGFAVCFFTAVFTMTTALKTGNFSLTSLLMQCSLVLTVVYGFIFWDEPVTALSIIGLVLIVAALVLCFMPDKRKAAESNSNNQADGAGESGKPQAEAVCRSKMSVKWVVSVLVFMAANAGCTILQKSQQLSFDGLHKGSFMMFAMLFAVVIAAVYFLLADKSGTKAILKSTAYYPAAAGLCNALVNLFAMILATRLNSAAVFPVLSVGSLIILQLASRFLFKERISAIQLAGIGTGIAAIIILSI